MGKKRGGDHWTDYVDRKPKKPSLTVKQSTKAQKEIEEYQWEGRQLTEAPAPARGVREITESGKVRFRGKTDADQLRRVVAELARLGGRDSFDLAYGREVLAELDRLYPTVYSSADTPAAQRRLQRHVDPGVPDYEEREDRVREAVLKAEAQRVKTGGQATQLVKSITDYPEPTWYQNIGRNLGELATGAVQLPVTLPLGVGKELYRGGQQIAKGEIGGGLENFAVVPGVIQGIVDANDPKKMQRNLEDNPLTAAIGMGLRNTGSRLTSWDRLKEDYSQNPLTTLLEDVGNVALAGGVAAKGVGLAGRGLTALDATKVGMPARGLAASKLPVGMRGTLTQRGAVVPATKVGEIGETLRRVGRKGTEAAYFLDQAAATPFKPAFIPVSALARMVSKGVRKFQERLTRPDAVGQIGQVVRLDAQSRGVLGYLKDGAVRITAAREAQVRQHRRIFHHLDEDFVAYEAWIHHNEGLGPGAQILVEAFGPEEAARRLHEIVPEAGGLSPEAVTLLAEVERGARPDLRAKFGQATGMFDRGVGRAQGARAREQAYLDRGGKSRQDQARGKYKPLPDEVARQTAPQLAAYEAALRDAVEAANRKRGPAERIDPALEPDTSVLAGEGGMGTSGLDRVELAAALRSQAMSEGGFTFHLIDANAPTEGWAVSAFPEREFPDRVAGRTVHIDDLTDAHIEEFAALNDDLLSIPGNHIGGWVDDQGNIWLDVSVVTGTLDEATALGRKHGQLEAYDIKGKVPVKLGVTDEEVLAARQRQSSTAPEVHRVPEGGSGASPLAAEAQAALGGGRGRNRKVFIEELSRSGLDKPDQAAALAIWDVFAMRWARKTGRHPDEIFGRFALRASKGRWKGGRGPAGARFSHVLGLDARGVLDLPETGREATQGSWYHASHHAIERLGGRGAGADGADLTITVGDSQRPVADVMYDLEAALSINKNPVDNTSDMLTVLNNYLDVRNDPEFPRLLEEYRNATGVRRKGNDSAWPVKLDTELAQRIAKAQGLKERQKLSLDIVLGDTADIGAWTLDDLNAYRKRWGGEAVEVPYGPQAKKGKLVDAQAERLKEMYPSLDDAQVREMAIMEVYGSSGFAKVRSFWNNLRTPDAPEWFTADTLMRRGTDGGFSGYYGKADTYSALANDYRAVAEIAQQLWPDRSIPEGVQAALDRVSALLDQEKRDAPDRPAQMGAGEVQAIAWSKIKAELARVERQLLGRIKDRGRALIRGGESPEAAVREWLDPILAEQTGTTKAGGPKGHTRLVETIPDYKFVPDSGMLEIAQGDLQRFLTEVLPKIDAAPTTASKIKAWDDFFKKPESRVTPTERDPSVLDALLSFEDGGGGANATKAWGSWRSNYERLRGGKLFQEVDGWSERAADHSPGSFLPNEEMYHATSAADEVLAEGLKGGADSGRPGILPVRRVGDNVVSVTADKRYAQAIAQQMRLAGKAARGDLTLLETLDDAMALYGLRPEHAVAAMAEVADNVDWEAILPGQVDGLSIVDPYDFQRTIGRRGSEEAARAVLKRLADDGAVAPWDALERMAVWRDDFHAGSKDPLRYGPPLLVDQATAAKYYKSGNISVVRVKGRVGKMVEEVGEEYELRFAAKDVKVVDEVERLFQRSGGRDRRVLGMTEISEGDARTVATLFTEQGANLGTFTHESAHVLRALLDEDDLAPLSTHYGVRGGKWTREADEAMAKDLETYIRTRGAPIPELDAAFGRIRHALTELWQRFKIAMGPDLDPAVVAFWDDWLSGGQLADEGAAGLAPLEGFADSVAPTSAADAVLARQPQRYAPFAATRADAAAARTALDQAEAHLGDLRARYGRDGSVKRGDVGEAQAAVKRARAVLERELVKERAPLERQLTAADIGDRNAARLQRRAETKGRAYEGAVVAAENSVTAAPARLRPMLAWNRAVVSGLRKEASDLAESGLDADASRLIGLAEEVPTTLAALEAAGIDARHFIHMRMNEAPAGTISYGTPKMPLKSRLKESRQRSGSLDYRRDPVGMGLAEGNEIAKVIQRQVADALDEMVGVRLGEGPLAHIDLAAMGADEAKRLAGEAGYVPVDYGPFTAAPASHVTPDIAFMPKHVVEAYRRAYYPPGVGEQWMRLLYDPVVRGWKAIVLPLSVAWNIANLLGNAFLAIVVGGVDPFTLSKNIVRAIKEYRASGPPGLREWSGPQRLYEAGWTRDAQDFVHSGGGLYDHNNRLPGRMAEALRAIPEAYEGVTGHLPPGLRQLSHPIRSGYGLNEFIDNLGRTGVYLSKLEKGASPDMAMRMSLRAMGDFSNLSITEKRFVKRVFPFWAWTKHMTTVAVTMPIEHPLRTAWMLSLGSQLADDDEWKTFLPRYLGGAVDIAGDVSLIPSQIAPFSTPIGLASDPTRTIMGSMAPPLKFALGDMTGVNPATGRPFSRPPYSAQTDEYGVEMPTAPSLWNQLGDYVPQTRYARLLSGREDLVRYDTGDPVMVDDENGNKIPLRREPREWWETLSRYGGIPLARRSELLKQATGIALRQGERERLGAQYREKLAGNGKTEKKNPSGGDHWTDYVNR